MFVFLQSPVSDETTADLISTVASLLGLHPGTVERCLCFDDAIACLSSMLGVIIGRWFTVTQSFPPPPQPLRQPFILDHSRFIQSTMISVLKIVVGIGALLVWRLAIKVTLPKILASVSHESNRPSNSKVSDISDDQTNTSTDGNIHPHLNPVPSVIDLTSAHRVSSNSESKLSTTTQRKQNGDSAPETTKGDSDASRYGTPMAQLYRFPISESMCIVIYVSQLPVSDPGLI